MRDTTIMALIILALIAAIILYSIYICRVPPCQAATDAQIRTTTSSTFYIVPLGQ